MGRQDTRLESEGAEFLVLGQLLIAGIHSYKTYTNMPGFDITATSAEHNTSARVSVKSRWRTKADGFIINNFDCDFVVLVKLNRGSKDRRAEVLPPDFFVVPVEELLNLPRSGWGKMSYKAIKGLDTFRDRWDLVASFLKSSVRRAKRTQSRRSTSGIRQKDRAGI